MKQSLGIVFGCLLVAIGGGATGLHTVVVVNQNNPESLAMGNLYCELRGVPPQNLLRLTNWTGGHIIWSAEEFMNALLRPLQSMLVARQLTNQIDYVVICKGFPYIIYKDWGPLQTRGTNTTTSMLYYGFKPDECIACPDPPSCNLPPGSTNPFAGSEDHFRLIPQLANRTNNFLAVMLTATNLYEALATITNGALGDASFPSNPVYLTKSTDTIRSMRHGRYDAVIFDARVAGFYHILRTNANGLLGLPLPASGFAGSVYRLQVPSNAFVPGSIADTFTSFSGRIFVPNDHTTILDFLLGGAALSYGTVVEPCAHLGKFPAPDVYFYLIRGYTGAEAYYMSITNPYQGLMVGDPLTAPFARKANIYFISPNTNQPLSGTVNLAFRLDAADPYRPLARVDLFIDGVWFRTITNISPQQGNQIHVWIRGYKTTYNVPAGATIKSVAQGLASLLNSPSFTNLTKVKATSRGDRIVLSAIDPALPASAITLEASNAIGTAQSLTVFAVPARPTFIESPAYGERTFEFSGAPGSNDSITLTITKTNGTAVSVGVTNTGAPTDLLGMLIALTNAVWYHPELQGPDGVVVDELSPGQGTIPNVVCKLKARSPGWQAARIRATVNTTGSIVVEPSGTQTLEENVDDLQPRNHLYIACGAYEFEVVCPLDTALLPDGFHTLSIVAYEGTSPRVPTRVDLPVYVKNTPLEVEIELSPNSTNLAIESVLKVEVVPNTNSIYKTELFTSGGLVGVTTNQARSTFALSGSYLGLGRHPIYAVVTTTSGQRYRTRTRYINVVDFEKPFVLHIAADSVLTISWPAIGGRQYQVLAADSLLDEFQKIAELIATNDYLWWTDSIPSRTKFYRVRSVR